jgi:RNA polymerase-binding transcription factor DksA
MHITQRQLRPLVRSIERREDELRREIAEERERAATEAFPELAEHAGDSADKAFARLSIGIEYQRIDGHLAEMRELTAARERLSHGAFGICVDCGEWIDPARLRASPAAARCATCQELHERRQAVRH